MSTLAYAAFTTSREQATPGTSEAESPPGVKTYVDALAALVPAEVLTLHALMISVTTQTTDGAVRIGLNDRDTLQAAFAGLIVLSIVLYVAARLMKGAWDHRLDYFRAAIPPLAFIGWTMLQRATAFDAVGYRLEDGARTVIGLFLAVLLGVAAAALASRADQKTPAAVGGRSLPDTHAVPSL